MALLSLVRNERTSLLPVIVGAALIRAGRLLACARARPPELAGWWELPGGKVEPGESERDALLRECREELAVPVIVGDQIGPTVPIPGREAVLKVYLATLVGEAEPQPLEHAELRWLAPDRFDSVAWLPADAPILAAIHGLLPAPAH